MKHIVEEVIEKLTTLLGADVAITLEIDGGLPPRLNSANLRTVIENVDTPKFLDNLKAKNF